MICDTRIDCLSAYFASVFVKQRQFAAGLVQPSPEPSFLCLSGPVFRFGNRPLPADGTVLIIFRLSRHVAAPSVFDLVSCSRGPIVPLP